MIGNLAALGFGPADIRGWSMWEYGAVIAGWNRAHDPDADKPAPPDISTLREARRLELEKGWNR